MSLTAICSGAARAEPTPTSPSPSPSSSSETSATPTTSSADLPAVQEHLHLALSPTEGIPGTSITATATGAEACLLRFAVAEGLNISFNWHFGHYSASTDSDSASVKFTVPEGATPGEYTVTASCDGFRNIDDTATFKVTSQPSLLLLPAEGVPRTQVTATTKGFGACPGGSSVRQTMSWRWDQQPLQTSPGANGSTVTFEVPAAASPDDEHTVTAVCGQASAKAPFKVFPIPQPALTLDKNQGLRGSQLTANGTGFTCENDHVQLLWDGNTLLADGPSGAFSVPLTVPADASISQHTVVASCRNHADITDSQSFTVIKDSVAVSASAALTLKPTRGAPGDAVQVSGDRWICTESQTVQLSWDGQPLANPSADASGHFETSISVPASARPAAMPCAPPAPPVRRPQPPASPSSSQAQFRPRTRRQSLPNRRSFRPRRDGVELQPGWSC